MVTTVTKDFFGHSITSTGTGTIREGSFGDVGRGQTARKGFVGTLLTPSCIKFLPVGHRWVSGLSSTWLVSVVSVVRFISVVSIVSVVARQVHNSLWDTHVVQAVLVGNIDVVEPRALTSLPGAGAEHAKVRSTAAGHMVAALLELDHSLTIIAALPSLLFSQVDKSLGLWILGAVAAGV
jgi:hypothetical protein